MSLLESNTGRNRILVVFASLFLVSLGMGCDAFADQIVTTVHVGLDPYFVSANPATDKVYVAGIGNQSITVIDGSSNKVVASIPITNSNSSTGIWGLDVNPVTNIVYATEPSFDAIYAINGSTNTVIANITDNSEEPTEVAVNPHTNKIYVTNYVSYRSLGQSVSVINGSTNKVTAVIPTCYDPVGLAVNPVTNKIYETCFHQNYGSIPNDHELVVIDGNKDNVTAIINTTCIGNIGVDINTNTIYVGGSSGTCVMDGNTNTFTGTIPAAGGTYSANPKTNKLYAADYPGNQLFVINETTNQVVSTFSTSNPHAISVNPNTNMVYVGNYVSNTYSLVTVIDSRTTPTQQPTGLNATTASSSQINLSWSAPANNGGSPITGYEVERSQGNLSFGAFSNSTSDFFFSVSNSTAFSDDGLDPSTTYNYVVFAKNSIGASPPSNTASAITNALPTTAGDVVTATIPVNGAYGVAVNPGTNMVYVANGGHDHVQVINGSTNTVTANVTTESMPGYYSCYTDFVAVNPVTNIIYADNGPCVYPSPYVPDFIPSKLFVINGTTNTVITNITLSGPQRDSSPSYPLAVNPVTNKIYVIPTSGVGGIDVVNGDTNQQIASIGLPYPSVAYDVTVNPKTDLIYVLADNLVYVIDGSTDSLVNSFSWGKSSENGIGINPITNRLYISNSDESVSVIDGSTYQVISNIPSVSYGFVSVNPSTNKIYVSDAAGGNQVAVLDGQTDKLAGQAQVGQSPSGIGINTNTDKIYVGNSASSTVSVIDGSVASQDFAVVSSPQTLSVPAGASENSTITAVSLDGFAGTVSLSASAPSSLSANINPSSVTVPSGGSASSRLVMSSNSSATAGQYTVTVTGTNGSVTHTAAINVFVLTVPSPPQNLQANAISASQICMNWYPPASNGGSQVTAYNIEGSTNNGTTWYNVISNMNSPDAANPSWCDSNQTPNTTYTYRVFAINSIGTSPPSNTASATTFSSVPSPPTGLTATTVSSLQINLNWTAPTNNGGTAITGYKIERNSGAGFITVSNTASTATTYDDTGLAANTTYTYRISAINSVGTSTPSNIASATTFVTVPSAPTGLVANATSPKNIHLSWGVPASNGGSSITGYKIMISTNGSSFTTLVSDTNNAGTTYLTSGLRPHTTYYFEVSAINSVGTSALSNVASAATR